MTCSSVLPERAYLGLGKQIGISGDSYNEVAGLTCRLGFILPQCQPNRTVSSRLTLRLLMSYIYIYIYMEHLFLMFLDHIQRRTTVGRTPLDE